MVTEIHTGCVATAEQQRDNRGRDRECEFTDV
ncbi:hypothetical protein VCR31J2_1290190 [Vibrio coralliirubri]|uniref:Uncharacterized protein n=1 Tax=Vibrio coralliirubri TaxID=1516159 RepID=A0AA86XSD4_9VIBR|nr:hypothetical protein VCR31J2_1290190 [Vibrio coralliirubri]